MDITFILEAVVVLGAIVMGTRAGGVGIGVWGGLGVAVLVFVFGEAPGEPPISALLIILAVVTAAALMQVAGGVDWMVKIAAGVIQRHPKQITLIAPLTAFLFTVGAGTSNILYPAPAGDLRRLLSERHPALTSTDGDGRAVRDVPGRVACLGGDGGDGDPDRGRAIQLRPGADPVDHIPGGSDRNHRHRPGRGADGQGHR